MTHNARKRRNMKNHASSDKEFQEWVVFAKHLLAQAQEGIISIEDFENLIKK